VNESSDVRRARLVDEDRRHLWHPFTQNTEWLAHDPLIIERAEGPFLVDIDGHCYLDGVSSLWCNVHGHGHPRIVAAIKEQLDRLQHSTLLGISHEPAIGLATRLIALAPRPLSRVFFSDSGSTAVEVACRMAFQYWRQSGHPERSKFVTLAEAYHGDTLGSVSLGFSEPFHRGYEAITFRVEKFAPPFLCPPLDGRRACDGENFESASMESLARLENILERDGDNVAAVVIEPLVQGAAGIWPQPASFVCGVRRLCDRFGCLFVCDEVATGFGRTGTMLAVEQADITPDILCLAKGLTGGYLPVAATLTTERVFRAFTGRYGEYRTLFHGHTYGGNPLGCAAALANLDVFADENTLARSHHASATLRELLKLYVAPLEHAGPVRQQGMMVGFDLWKDFDAGERFDADERRAYRATLAARQRGVFLRPLGDTMVLMPPLTLSDELLEELVMATAAAVRDVTEE